MKKLSSKLSAKRILKSEKSLQINREKNFLVWLTEFELFYDAKKIKELKKELVSLGANEKTVNGRIGMFNSAKKNEINLSQFNAFQQVELANKGIKNETKKAVNGNVVDVPEKTAQNQQDAEIVKAQNENDLVMLLANPKFKEAKKLILDLKVDLSLVLKALKTV